MSINRQTSWPIATVLAVVFIALQISSADYGARINDLPFVVNYAVNQDVVSGSALERENIVGKGAGESLDRWMMRFKLYSIEADEHLSIMALARIKPGTGQFDPHFYQYGGAWLYPLGAWYFALSKTGIIDTAPLEAMFAAPDKMDAVYLWGRIFVILSVALAGIVLFSTALRISTPSSALLIMAIFLCAPATIMFSQVLKPHWYALLWVNISLFGIVQAWSEKKFERHLQVLVGVALGLAVGSATTFGLFAVGVWLAMAIMVRCRHAPVHALVLVPAIATGALLVSNPYLIFNYPAYAVEAAYSSGWFTWRITPDDLWSFIENSFAPGFGIAFCTVMLAVFIKTLVTGSGSHRWMAMLLAVAIVVIAAMTSSIRDWHINVRYLPWFLPVALLFLVASLRRGRNLTLAGVLTAGLIQAAPLMLAYHDENNDTRSTRFMAARWIEENVPVNAALCFQTKSLAPYEAPPIDFTRYQINDPECKTMVSVERQADAISSKKGWRLIVRFQPRYSPPAFPLVFSHINPQISIYQSE